jgi:cation:H+ antiporter
MKDMLFLFISIFIASAVLLYVSGNIIVKALVRLSRRLEIQEFVVAFFIMALAASLPNLFVGITSALDGIPELSLGDIFGNNFIAMTLAVAAAVFFSPKKEIESKSQTAKGSLVFTTIAALLPVLLIIDGNLSRIDGVILIGLFVFYVFWLLSKKERFGAVYGAQPNVTAEQKNFAYRFRQSFKDIGQIIFAVSLLVLSSYGIVSSASYFASAFGVSLILVGLLITGLGNALPEVYFSIISARRGETSLILGNLMGSVIFPATLVLGIIVLIHPIVSLEIDTIAVSRAYLLVAAVLFHIFTRTKEKIGHIEGLILLLLYVAFVLSVLLTY